MISDKPAMMSISARNKARAGVLLGLVAASAGGGCSTTDQQNMASMMTINMSGLTPEQMAEMQAALEQQQSASGTESGGGDAPKADPSPGSGGSPPQTDPNGLPM